MNNRHIDLIEALSKNQTSGLSIDEFAQLKGVTLRTIYNDLKIVRKVCDSLNCPVIKLENKRMLIRANQKMVEQIKRKVTFELVYRQYEDNPQNRKNEILISLLLDKEPTSINKLAEKYYVSRTSIVKTIKQIEDSLPDNLELLKNHKGMIIKGNEKSKRELVTKVIQNIIENIPEQDSLIHVLSKVIPTIDIAKVLKLIQDAASERKMFISEDIKIGILVHLCIMIKSDFSSSILSESFYIPKEIEDFSRDIVHKIEAELNMKIPDENIAYLKIFLQNTGVNTLNIEAENTVSDSEAQRFVDNLLIELKSIFLFDFSSDEIFVKHLLWHCTSMLSRLRSGKHVQLAFAQEIKDRYSSVFNSISFLIFELLPKEFQHISIEEISLLAIYIQSALEKKSYSKKILIVCSEGLIFSELIKRKLLNYFPKLDVVETLSVEEAQKLQYPNFDIDFIVSTEKFATKFPLVIVSPMIKSEEIEYVKVAMSAQQENLEELLEKNDLYVYQKISLKSMEKALQFLCQQLLDRDLVTEGYLESVLDREAKLSTALNSRVALPHGSMKYVKKSAIVICTLTESIPWGTTFVDCIILLAIGEDGWKESKRRLSVLYDIVSSEEKIQSIINSKDRSEILKAFSAFPTSF